MFSYTLQTRYAETAQDGIVHHSSYVIYYEAARIAYLQDKGYDITSMEKEGILCPVVKLQAEYLRPLLSLEQVIVKVRVKQAGKVRFSILHEIFKGQLKIAFAVTEHCFIDRRFKPQPIPLPLQKAFLDELSCEGQ